MASRSRDRSVERSLPRGSPSGRTCSMQAGSGLKTSGSRVTHPVPCEVIQLLTFQTHDADDAENDEPSDA